MGQWGSGGGFSVDASVRIEADDRAGLERLLRYCARPPFALERLEAIDAQRLMYHLPKPQPDGRTDFMLTPLEFINRLAVFDEKVHHSTLLQTILGATFSQCPYPSPDILSGRSPRLLCPPDKGSWLTPHRIRITTATLASRKRLGNCRIDPIVSGRPFSN